MTLCLATNGQTPKFAALGLAESFASVLERADARHSTLRRGGIGGVKPGPFSRLFESPQWRYLAYVVHNQSTQSGMRPSERLPAVILYDTHSQKEVHRLAGHTDYIAWTAFSPDGRHIGSVSWDGTMRMYDTTTGDLEWVVDELKGRQAWIGAFSPDSRYVLFSSSNGP